MYLKIVFTLTFVLLYQISLSALISERQNNFEDPIEIAKQIEKKFKVVKHQDNFTTYLLNDEYDDILPLSLSLNDPNPPDHLDWRDKDMIGPVKNQLQCNACWAFSSAACIESHLAIYKGTKTMLSEQFLIDCIHYGKNDAPKCGSYSLLKAYGDIVSDYGGVLASSDYRPYSGSAGQCTYTKPPPVPLPVSGFVRVPPNEDAMVFALFKYGPLSAAINDKSMEKYTQGSNYIDEPTDDQCSPRPEHMNHAILIVGYNVYVDNQRKVPYWIIKNSWGKDWGDQGFYYLVRGRNACGISNDVSFGIIS